MEWNEHQAGVRSEGNPGRAVHTHCRLRHRPTATRAAKGFLFLSLEDETGIANAIVTPDVYERNRILLTSGGIPDDRRNLAEVRTTSFSVKA
jgi:hypothetical protein